MANKTFIPAFRASVGDWQYYICQMKYAEVARQVNFAYELGGNRDLGTLIQRGISKRTEAITEYLLTSDHRFLGAMIVAVWGGDPEYQALGIDDPDGLLSGIDRGFGVLTFDGTQQYFALDGQHRLRAIKDAIKQKPELGREDICVLLVSHYDSSEGKTKTRRLFTNINRNAKATTPGENIALDVDDGFAILTRRIIDEHDFLKDAGRIKVFTRQAMEGDVRLAKGSVSRSDKSAFTTMAVLYQCLNILGFGLDESMFKSSVRPTDDVLEESYAALTTRLNDLLSACGELREKMEKVASVAMLRSQKGAEGEGHPFLRPVIQKTVARACRHIVMQELLTWDELMAGLRKLNWRIAEPPWRVVFNVEQGKMAGAKDNANALHELLLVHLAPTSKQAIKRARKNYKDIKGEKYPIEAEELENSLKSKDSVEEAPDLAEDASATSES